MNTPTPTAGQPAQTPAPADSAVDHLRISGAIAQDPDQLLATIDRVADRYLAEVLHVPAWAMPSGTEGTPLHPLSLQVRSLARRRVQMMARMTTALQTLQGHTERALGVVQTGTLPSWTLLEIGPSAETVETAEAARMLDRVLDELAGTLVAVCEAVDRWLKAEAPGVTAETMGVKLERDELYQVAEDERLPRGMDRSLTRARPTGERRPPRAGEWYLSGAVVEAYRAPNDLSSEFRIAELVQGELRFREVDRP